MAERMYINTIYNIINGLGSITSRLKRTSSMVYLFLFFIISKAEHNFSIKVACLRVFLLGFSFRLDLSPYTPLRQPSSPPLQHTHTHAQISIHLCIIIFRPTLLPVYLPTFIISTLQTFLAKEVR